MGHAICGIGGEEGEGICRMVAMGYRLTPTCGNMLADGRLFWLNPYNPPYFILGTAPNLKGCLSPNTRDNEWIAMDKGSAPEDALKQKAGDMAGSTGRRDIIASVDRSAGGWA